MTTEPPSEDVYCLHCGVLCYPSENGPQCPRCPKPDNDRRSEPKPKPKPKLDTLEPFVSDFCQDKIDHHDLIAAAAVAGLKWGSGVRTTGDTKLSITFGRADHGILVFEAARGHSEYLVVVKEDVYWTTDVGLFFHQTGESDSNAGKGATARTRKPGRGTRRADTLVIDQPGLVEVSRQPSPSIQEPQPEQVVASKSTPPAEQEAPKPTPKSRVPVGLLLTAIALVAGYFAYQSYNSFPNQIDRAFAANDIFGPSGAAAIYRQAQTGSPQSAEVTAAAVAIRSRIEPQGEEAYSKWYKDSVTPDWVELSQTYELLSEFEPSNKEFEARKAYAQAQVRFDLEPKDYLAAYELYNTALAQKPGWVLAINGIAKVYANEKSKLHDDAKAVQLYRKAIEADPQFVWAYKNLGVLYIRMGNPAEAVELLTTASRLAPGRATIVSDLNQAERMLKQQRATRRRR